MANTKIGISLPEDFLKEVDKFADMEDRIRSNFIYTVLKKGIADKKNQLEQGKLTSVGDL